MVFSVRMMQEVMNLLNMEQICFILHLFSGISDHDTVNNQLYNAMSDGDYSLTAIGAFLNPVYKDPSQKIE